MSTPKSTALLRSWTERAMVCAVSLTALSVSAGEAAPPAKLVHRFLEVEISPDGAFVASVEGDSPVGGFYPPLRQLVIRRLSTGAARKIVLPCGDAPECWPDSPAWTRDGSRLSFGLRAPGTHAYSVYSVTPDATAPTQQLAFDGTIADLQYGPDGQLAMLATEHARKEVGATQPGVPVAGDLDQPTPEQRIGILERGAVRWVSPPDWYVYEYEWQPDGKGFLGTAAPGDGDNNWWSAKLYAFAADSGAPRVLYSPKDIHQQIANPRVSPDGRTVAFIAGLMSDFNSTGGDVYTVPTEGGGAVNLMPGMTASATSVGWSCSGMLRAQLLAADKVKLVEFERLPDGVSIHALWKGAESLHGRHAGVSQACPSETSAVAHESFTAPPEIETGAIGSWRDLTAVNAGLSLPAHVQSLSWKSEGFDVQGWLMLPDHAKGKMPMVTVIHGGPAAAAVPSFSGPGLFTALIDRGYAIFRPNPRGSFGQGERFTVANVRDLGLGDLRDVLSGVDAALTAAPIDEERLGVTGGSYGGFMTMFAVTQTNRFKAAVAAAGISNWLSYYGENGIDGWLQPYFGASVYEDPAVYAQSSPINFIRKVHTPTFAWAGEHDIECPAVQTQEFWHALKALGVPTAVMIYPGEGHGLREPEHTADAMRRTVEWFDRYLK
jgi:dipeptidyl aminopeptidase/acylaminoacyl peptidase